MSTILFVSKECKKLGHSLCHGRWNGLGFDFYCECGCHEKNSDEAVGFGAPESATSAHHLSEVTNRSD